MRVLIVPDKFKGTLTAQAAAEAIATGWRQSRPDDALELLPMSDGGDGFGEVMSGLLGGRRETSKTCNAAHEASEAAWYHVASESTAIVESAGVIGLAMLPPGKFHPFELDTLGLGKTMNEIFSRFEVKDLIVGIGGSATNDGGFGMARALGFTFLDNQKNEINDWTQLPSLDRIIVPTRRLTCKVTIATDVQNTLLGAEGATRIYGPQKGLKPEDFPKAEGALQRLTDTVKRDLQVDAANEPGTGAAGGLGYGLRVFLNGTFESGFHLFARLSKLEERIARADLVITAEGAIDTSTAMGKGTGAVAGMASALKKDCIAFAGAAAAGSPTAFRAVHSITPGLASESESKKTPPKYLSLLARKVASELKRD
jgi:glycerate kinase